MTEIIFDEDVEIYLNELVDIIAVALGAPIIAELDVRFV